MDPTKTSSCCHSGRNSMQLLSIHRSEKGATVLARKGHVGGRRQKDRICHIHPVSEIGCPMHLETPARIAADAHAHPVRICAEHADRQWVVADWRGQSIAEKDAAQLSIARGGLDGNLEFT